MSSPMLKSHDSSDEEELYGAIPTCALKSEVPTFLYSLEPMGVGTPFVESLASYLTRLSAAHMLPPSAMLQEVIAPLVPWENHNLRKGRATGRQAIILHMSGIGKEAAAMVDILESLTGRSGLDHLTMLPFSGLLAKYQLQKESSFWCIHCLEEQREANQPIHYPLLWSLKTATKCPIHRYYLRTYCQHCSAIQPVIGSRSVPGCCNNCKGWLGRGADGKVWAARPDEHNFFVRLFEWHNTVGCKRNQPSFPGALEYLIGHHMKRKDSASIAKLLHLPEGIVEGMLDNSVLPFLGLAFWIGRVFKVDPFDILTKTGEEMAAMDLKVASKTDFSAFYQNRINWKQLEGLLRDVASGKASTMRVEDIARVYRCRTDQITSRFSGLCSQLSKRIS